MPNPNAFVSTVTGVDRERGEFAVGAAEREPLRFDPSDRRSAAYADLLDEVRLLGRPVYVEVDPATSFVTRVLLPHVARVVRVDELANGSVRVLLDPSHAVHLLPADAEDRDETLRLLVEARDTGEHVVVSEHERRIVDVRRPGERGPGGPDLRPEPEPPGPMPPRPGPAPPPFPDRWTRTATPALVELVKPLKWALWPLYWLWSVSPSTAQKTFDAMNATSCDPATVPAPCIPFKYPDDGCFARAHEMVRLMRQTGLSPRKVWNFEHPGGDLVVDTANSPDCEVRWWYHVAPTLRVRGTFPTVKTMVIDPALFTTPVTTAAWKALQQDPASTLEYTSADQYGPSGSTDPSYTKTDDDLAQFRLALKQRVIDEGGPPPYPC